MTMKKEQKGFTLIELLVVVAIIGLLASVVIASLSTARQKGRDARRLADIKQIQMADELYYDSNSGSYATSSSLMAPTYISAIPTDPRTNVAYAYAGLQGTAASVATCGAYHLGAILEVLSNNALLNDVDAATATICTSSAADFSGLSTGGAGGTTCETTAGTAQTNGSQTEKCFDVKP